MSSARRLQEDYRRIIGLQDETRGLDDDLPRMRIGGQRGVWQIGNNELKTGNAGGEDEDGNTVDPVTPDEGSDNQNEDGSGEGGSGTDPSNPLEPEITDPENPESGADVNDSTFGGGWATGGPKSFVDCETGQCIELVEVGGYVPPEGWDDADTPPQDQEWIKGVIWMTGGQGSISHLDRYLVPSTAFNSGFAATLTGFHGLQLKHSYVGSSSTPPSYTVLYKRSDGQLNTGGSISPIVAGSGENDVPIFASSWPADDCIQLAPNSDGNWAASQYENPSDMTAKYSEPKSQLTLCTPSGETVEIYNRVGGGHVYFNSDQGIWAGSDSSGRVRSFGSTSTLNQEIARPRN